MPLPFNQKLSQHTEKQYLELETNYLNLFNFVQSLLTITENKDINSDSQRLIHFNALTIRLTEGIKRFQKFTKDLRSNSFSRNSASSDSEGNPYDVRILTSKEEKELIIEALEHMANSYPDLKVSDKFQQIANDIK
jgi:3-deoxy-D-manno-octulosonic-acid transferase